MFLTNTNNALVMNNLQPLVSICCITYNQESYICKTVEGFLLQKTTFPIEIIIHDDASTDRTAEIVKEYAIKSPDLILPIFQKENQWSKKEGSMSARFVFPHVRGKYIAMCEGDDYWTDPLKLQKQVDFLELHEDYGLVHTNYMIHNEFSNNPDMISGAICFNGRVMEKLIINNFIATLTVCFRSSLLSSIDFNEIKSNNFLMADYPTWLQIANLSKIHYIDEVTSIYRVMPESVSHSLSFKKTERFLLSVLQIQLYYHKKFDVKNVDETELKLKQYNAIMDIAFASEVFYKAKEYIEKMPINCAGNALRYFFTRNILLFKAYNRIIMFKKRLCKIKSEFIK